MKQLRSVWFIALKDLKVFATDRLALSFALLFPFLFVIMFTFLLADTGSEDNRLELNMVTQEAQGGLSYQIIEGMETRDDSQLEAGDPKIVWLRDYDEALQRVEQGRLDGFLTFPPDFTQGVMMGYGTHLEVITHAEATHIRAALNGLASAIASRVGSQQIATEATIALLLEQEMASSGDLADIGQVIQQIFPLQEGATTEETFIEFTTHEVGEVEAKNPSNHVIPGYLVMFVFFAAALAAEAIVRERQNNTLERLLASSVKRASILGGIFAGTAARGLVQILIFWAVGILAFKIDLGASPFAVIVLSLLVVIMSSAFAIMLATLVQTEHSASSIAVLTSLVLAPLGGCWWPLFITPHWMQFMAKLTPHGWATTGFNKLMLFGADFSAVVPEMLALVGFAAIFSIIGILRFRTSAT